jgi:NADH dehydrogenase
MNKDDDCMKKVLITGATGFIGSHLVPELIKNNYKVKCFVRKNDDLKFKKNLEKLEKLNVEIFYGDLTDKNSFIKTVKGIDVVINLAALLGSTNVKLNYNVNVLGSKNIVESCQEQKVKRIISMSSIAGFRKYKGVYGKTKCLSEKVFLDSRLDVTILRPTLVYGEGSRGLTKILKYIKKFPLIIPIIGSGNFKSQPVYVNDVVKTIIKCIESEKTIGKTYFVGGPSNLTFNEIIDLIISNLKIKKIKVHVTILICKIIGKIFETLQEKPEFSIRDVMSVNEDTIVDIKPLIKDIDFKPIEFKDYMVKYKEEIKRIFEKV